MISDDALRGRTELWTLVLIFFAFGALIVGLQFLSPNLTGQDDGYYHLAHALSYWQGTPFSYPVFSTYNSHPVDLYYLYHVLLSPFSIPAGHGDFHGALVLSRFFSGILGGLYAAVFYALARRLGDYIFSFGTRAHSFALWAVAYLFLLNPLFLFRMTLVRPHVIASLLFMVALYFAIRKNAWMVFFIACLAPFFYSFTIMMLVPPAAVLCAALMFRRQERLSPYLYVALASIVGLCVGVALRPDALSYVYNGIYVHALALISRFTGTMTVEGVELYTLKFGLQSLVWFYPFAAAVYLSFKERWSRFGVGYSTLCLLSLGLFFLMLLVNRTVEYFAPVAALCTVGILYKAILSDPYRKAMSTVAGSRYVLPVAFAFLSLFSVLGIVRWIVVQPSTALYERVSEFLREDSGGRGLVFNSRFEMYPRLVFFNPSNRYMTGMGYIFSYVYDVEQFRKLESLNAGPFSGDVYDFLKTDLGVSYVVFSPRDFYDAAFELRHTYMLQNISSDPRFRLVYVDKENSEMRVYKL